MVLCMKKSISIFLTILMVFALSSCGKKDEMNIYFPIENDVRSLDPQIVNDAAGMMIALNIYDCLVKFGSNGEIIPAAAESWEITDGGLVYTFNISPNSTWYYTNTAKNGLGEKLPENLNKQVTAADFEFALKRAVGPLTNSPERELLSGIQNAREILDGEKPVDELGVKALSDKKLKITLTSPDDTFLEVLARPLAAPCNEIFFNATGGRYGMEMKYICSNGPFFLTRKNAGSYIRISKSDEYLGSTPPKLQAVWFYINADKSLIPDKIKNGTYEAGFVDNFAASGFPDEYSKTETASAVRCLIFNTEDRYLKNTHLRKAISTSISLDTITEHFGATADSFITDNARKLMGDFKQTSSYKYDKTAAYDMLKKAYEDLKITNIELTVSCTEEFEIPLKYIMQDWQEALGTSCSITLKVMTASELRSAVRAGDYDIAFYTIPSYVDENKNFGVYVTDAENNLTKFKDENYDNIVESIKTSTENAKRELCSAAEKYLYDQAVIRPISPIYEVLVVGEEAEGIYLQGSSALTYFHEAVRK